MKISRYVAILIVLTACSKQEVIEKQPEPVPLPTVQIETVRPGLSRSFAVTGEVEAKQKATLDADTRANVAVIATEIGDKVQKGDIVMRLTSDTLNTRIENASINFNTAKQNIEQTKQTTKTSIEQSQIAFDTAKITYDSLLLENKKKRKQAREAYDASIINLDLNVASATTQLTNSLQATHNALKSALNIANSIFEFSDNVRDLDSIKETHIAVRDPIAKADLLIKLELLDEKNRLGTLNFADALTLLETAEREFNRALALMEESVTSTRYTQANLQSDITSLSSALQSITTTINSVRTSQDSLQTALQISEKNVSQTHETARAQLETTMQQLDSSEVQAKRNVEQAKVTLENAKAMARGSEINAESAFNSVASELRSATTASKELVIRAPFSGRVQDIAIKNGDEVSAGQELITIENTDTVTVVADVTPEEIKTISIGDPVIINSDIKGSITSISPSADPVTKKYSVEIDLTKSALQSGEFVQVAFISTVAAKTGRYFVPISSVQIEATDTYIWYVTQANNTTIAKKASVNIGNIQGKHVEVTSGVRSGMQIITEGSRNLTEENTSVTVQRS